MAAWQIISDIVINRVEQVVYCANLTRSKVIANTLLSLNTGNSQPMRRDRKQPVNHGRPALVCVPTGKTIEINGKTYRVLKLMYDLKGEYMPLATLSP